MNPKSLLLAALVAGLPVVAFAQASPAAPLPSAPAAATAPATPAEQPAAQPAAPDAPAAPATRPPAVVPQAYPAKIALIAFQQCVILTNEGQRALADVQKKYAPKQTELETLNNDIESLKKQLQAAPANLSDEERATRMKNLDGKQKQLDRETEDARTAYQADLQEAYGKVAQKVNSVLLSYVEKNGYTILLDVGGEQSSVMWAAREPSADITDAVVTAYNASTPGITAPPPSAPSASRPKPATAAPHTTTPKPATTTPKPATH
jgi:outer membrane protein